MAGCGDYVIKKYLEIIKNKKLLTKYQRNKKVDVPHNPHASFFN